MAERRIRAGSALSCQWCLMGKEASAAPFFGFVRRMTRLPWWQQLFTVGGLVGVGVAALGVEIVAH